MNEYQKAIQAEVSNYVETLLDTWQCQDWEVSAREFFNEWAKQFNKFCDELANELEEAEEEEGAE